MIKEALHAYAKAQPSAFGEERLQTIGASDVGQCERRVWFGKNEIAHDAEHSDRWGAKTRGTIYERAWWNPAMAAHFGDRLKFCGEEQQTFFDSYLSATPDALIVDCAPDELAHLGVADIEGDSIVVDCKTVDPRVKLDGPKPEHKFQLIVQMGLIRRRTQYRPTYGLVSYTDTSFWDDGAEYVVKYDEAIYQAALSRARRIMTANDPWGLKPEGIIAGGKECDYCPFASRCKTVQHERAAATGNESVSDPVLASEIAIKARLAKLSREEAKRSEDKARALEQEIKEALSNAGARRASFGDVSVAWSAVKGRPSWDNKGLREAAENAGIDTSRFSTVGDPSDRLLITKPS